MLAWLFLIFCLTVNGKSLEDICPRSEGLFYATSPDCLIYYRCDQRIQQTGTCFPWQRFDIHSLTCKQRNEVDCNPEYADVWKPVYGKPENLSTEGEDLLVGETPITEELPDIGGIDGSAGTVGVPGLGGAGVGGITGGIPGIGGSGVVPGIGGITGGIPGIGGSGVVPGIGGITGGMPGVGGSGEVPGIGGITGGIPGIGGSREVPGIGGITGGIPGIAGSGEVPGIGGITGGIPGLGEAGEVPGVGGITGGIPGIGGSGVVPGIGGITGGIPGIGGSGGVPGIGGITGGIPGLGGAGAVPGIGGITGGIPGIGAVPGIGGITGGTPGIGGSRVVPGIGEITGGMPGVGGVGAIPGIGGITGGMPGIGGSGVVPGIGGITGGMPGIGGAGGMPVVGGTSYIPGIGGSEGLQGLGGIPGLGGYGGIPNVGRIPVQGTIPWIGGGIPESSGIPGVSGGMPGTGWVSGLGAIPGGDVQGTGGIPGLVRDRWIPGRGGIIGFVNLPGVGIVPTVGGWSGDRFGGTSKIPLISAFLVKGNGIVEDKPMFGNEFLVQKAEEDSPTNEIFVNVEKKTVVENWAPGNKEIGDIEIDGKSSEEENSGEEEDDLKTGTWDKISDVEENLIIKQQNKMKKHEEIIDKVNFIFNIRKRNKNNVNYDEEGNNKIKKNTLAENSIYDFNKLTWENFMVLTDFNINKKYTPEEEFGPEHNNLYSETNGDGAVNVRKPRQQDSSGGFWYWCGSGRFVFVQNGADGSQVCLQLQDPEFINREGNGSANGDMAGHTFLGSGMFNG